jgi:LmbE family N-acetylglucosaminyl deacetylase
MLTSRVWQKDLSKTSFAYLLTLEKGLTDFPACNLDQVIEIYGRPNSSTVIAGTLEHPQELLLFYDKGMSVSSPTNSQDPATVAPINLDHLPNTNCNVPSVMNIMAHQDDDLLFSNPDLLHDIQAGHCIRTIYITAGDSGRDSFYWLGREKGSEAAYSIMLGSDAVWVERIVKLSDKQYITVANPKGNSKVSLIFMHLPDGNMRGEGFGSSNHENLARLLNQTIPAIHSVDSQSEYTSDQLINALATLMHTYRPAEIRTQSNDEGMPPPDHSDHITVGRFVQRAYSQYEQNQFEGRLTIPIKYYMGYPIANMAPNVFGSDLEQKQAAFLRYTGFYGGTCHTREGCSRDPAYGAYLRRQYTTTH